LESILSINEKRKSIDQTPTIPLQNNSSLLSLMAQIQNYPMTKKYYTEPEEHNIIIQGVSFVFDNNLSNDSFS
jgi:hypothetical protein